ncbi:MAG: Rieske 2Fe-2S domain-containing protein [Pyrinomonadaceae bacterium]|nr:Rieske 2Fe-2S domain-containing protein [Pyrinomonadaceae bacterium]
MKDNEYIFEENLARAYSLPSRFYTEPSVLEEEKMKVFQRTWQLVGRTEQVKEDGQYFTATVGDEPVVVVRGMDERVRAFSNVCRHRAGPVAEGCGTRKSFRCGYHGWSYALDGRLINTPEFDRVENFSRQENCLPEFRVEAWGPLLFVNLDKLAAPLHETLEDIPRRVGHRNFEAMRLAARRDWFVNCNWKVYVDNYLEGYHIPIVHPSLNREIDYEQYRTETKRFYSIQHSPIRPDGAIHLKVDEKSGEDEAQYFWIFPNLMLNVYPDNYSTNIIVPIDEKRTLTVFEWYFLNPELDETSEAVWRTVAFSDEIQLEDIKICEAVQRGLRSQTYRQGRYSVRRENGVHHFHGLLAKFFARP